MDTDLHHSRDLALGDDYDDVAPAWFAFSVAGFFSAFSVIFYVLLLVAEKKVEKLNRDATTKSNADRGNSDKAIRRTSSMMRISMATIDYMAESELSKFDKWIEKRGETLRHFILSSLVFFAIPNLFILGGMQLNFSITFFSTVLGLAGLISALIMIAVLYFSSPKRHCIFQPEEAIYVACNKYEHLGLPLIHIVLLGIGQLLLLSLYVFGLFEAGQPPFNDIRKYAYYMLGILMQVVYGYDQDIWKGVHDHYVFWVAALQAHHLGDDWEYHENDGTVVRFNVQNDKKVFIRFLFSTIINTTGLFTIMMGLPIQVANVFDPLDFVLNVVAALYIVEWDDLGDSDSAVFRCAMSQPPLANGIDHEATGSEPTITYTPGSDDKHSNRNNANENRCSCQDDIALLKGQLAIMAKKINHLETKFESFPVEVTLCDDSSPKRKDSKRSSKGLSQLENSIRESKL